MKEFMFIYRGGDPEWMANASADDKREIMANWGGWIEKLAKAGNLVTGGTPLEFHGKRLKKDGVLTDIAASELKELVSGYSIVKAESYEQAATFARECPIFRHPHATVEIRTVVAM